MRIIKFRGKVIGDTEAQSYWMFVTPDSGSWEQFWSITRKETRGQFTDMLDKNGKEIYIGDIVKYGDLALNDAGRFGEKPWEHLPEGMKEDDISTVRGFYEIKGDIPSLFDLYEALTENPDVLAVEVIGNIYEHPGLLDKPQG